MTTPDTTIVCCGQCMTILNESSALDAARRTSCPSCGSLSRHFKVFLHEQIPAVHDRVDIKARHGDTGKPFHQIRSGDVLQRDGTWKRLERTIDRDNDRYTEKVIVPETGEVLHFQDEPLSQHRGHGSDRKRAQGPTMSQTD